MYRSPAILKWLYPSLVWRIPEEEKKIYLTFDDGPVPGPTEFVLDELKKVNAKATFFCIGDNVGKHPDIFRQVLEAGHVVGNHTFNHWNGWKYSSESYFQNVALCDNVMGGKQLFFRPPYGRIKRSQISLLADRTIVMWDVLTHDYAQSLSEDRCLRGTIKATRPGSIVVFHDSLKAERNMKYVLPRFLNHFAALGFEFHGLPPGK